MSQPQEAERREEDARSRVESVAQHLGSAGATGPLETLRVGQSSESRPASAPDPRPWPTRSGQGVEADRAGEGDPAASGCATAPTELGGDHA